MQAEFGALNDVRAKKYVADRVSRLKSHFEKPAS